MLLKQTSRNDDAMAGEGVMDIGLIGLGGMGSGIAKSLLRAGHRVVVYNRTQARAEALRADGAVAGATAAEACRGEAVLTMLADDAAVESQVFGVGGVLASLSRGAIHVSCSTISVALSDRLAAEHTKAGQEFVSAPVFGRPDAAEAGRLAVVAAGPGDAVARCKPIFEGMGPKLLVIGEKPSLANVVKLSGNFLIASVLESLSEAIAFARKSGVDAGTLVEFLTSTLFNAPVYKTYGGLIVEGNYDKVGFALPLGLKDTRLVLQAAEARNVPMPIASVIRDRFIAAIARGKANMDWSALGQLAAEDAGLTPTSPSAK
jgi:3-hydroxyisobutyrate dehydrogenase-like beta-hydroxyacid dehydrogenase